MKIYIFGIIILLFCGCNSTSNTYENSLNGLNETIKSYNILIAQQQQYGIEREILGCEYRKKEGYFSKDTSMQNFIEKHQNNIKKYQNIKKIIEDFFDKDLISLKNVKVLKEKLLNLISELKPKYYSNEQIKYLEQFEEDFKKIIKSGTNSEKKNIHNILKSRFLNFVSAIFGDAGIYTIPQQDYSNNMCGFYCHQFYILSIPNYEKINLGETCRFRIMVQNPQITPIFWKSDLIFNYLNIENRPNFIKNINTYPKVYEIELPLTSIGKKQIILDIKGINLYQDTAFKYIHEIEILPN